MQINQSAPAAAAATATIQAPLSLVWAVHTDIVNWKNWNPDVSRSDLLGPLAVGTEFHWTAAGAPIASRIEELDPEARIAWSGRTIGIRAVHVWTFETVATGVRVHTEESFEGWIVRLLKPYMQRMLSTSLEKGLAALKEECERQSSAENAFV